MCLCPAYKTPEKPALHSFRLACVCIQIESEDLLFTLETVVEKFGEEIAPYAVGLCQHLAAAFWRIQVGSVCHLMVGSIHNLQLPSANTGVPLTHGYDAGFVR